MHEQVLRDKNGILLGKIKEVSGQLELRNRHGILMGKYNPNTDQTRDRHGALVGTGNLLTMLLKD
ncbi:MAG: hypothetical protein ABRQ25_14825 [Clostridiaceae bacterium]